MSGILYGIIAVLLVAPGVLFLRLQRYRKQVEHIVEELSVMEEEDTNYRLSSYCHVGRTEEMIESVNRIVEGCRRELMDLRKENTAYRESITCISHDIRTPLTSAKGYVQMLQKPDVSDEKKEEYANVIEHRLDALNDMLTQLFEYARIEAGELQLKPECINACNLFAETISLFYDEFALRASTPKVEIPDSPCYVMADRQAFVRIVENLIKNALVHGNGGYEMALFQEKEKMCIRISNLTDKIEEKDMERIFDRFYTTDQSRSRRTTGLGLAIVKKFANLLGGEAEASLQGGRFGVTVRLPLAQCG